MIKCPFCNSVFPENTLFCEECGSYLPPSDSQTTDPLTSPVEAKGRRRTYKTLVLSVHDGGRIERRQVAGYGARIGDELLWTL